MEILRSIALYTEDKQMPFLVIGGHAVNSFGISRQTGDIDLLVQRKMKPEWLTLMKKLHYTKGQDDDRFARFRPDQLAAWPIDLMFVDQNTFSKLYEESIEADMGVARVRVAGARHLATLKIHALKHFQEHRFAKDYSDLIGLLRTGKTGISEDDLSKLCIKYADIELFHRLKQDLGKL